MVPEKPTKPFGRIREWQTPREKSSGKWSLTADWCLDFAFECLRICDEQRDLRCRFDRAIERALNFALGGNRLRGVFVRVLERRIPKLAAAATMRAHRRALDAGNKVLIAEAGELREVSPDGRRHTVREIERSVKIRKGRIFEIK